MKTTHSLGTLVQSYLCCYLPAVKGVSPHTILAYRDTLKLLLRYVAECRNTSPDALSVEDVSEACVLSFLNHIEKSRRNCPRTRNARLAGIRSLFEFIGRENPELLDHCRSVRLIPFKRTDHKTMEYLTAVEMKAVIEAADVHSATGIRDRALLLTLYNTGARVKEVTDLILDDLRLDSPSQVKMLGKGRKQRACPLWPESVAALRRCIEIRKPRDPSDCHVFLNVNGRPITRFGCALRGPTARAKGLSPGPFAENQDDRPAYVAAHDSHAPDPGGE